MDDDDPEKRIAELERSLAENYPASETPVQEVKPADTSWAAPPPTVPPAVPMPPTQYPGAVGGPAPGLYGRGRGSVVWQRRSPAFRFVWIIAAFWAVMIPVGIGFSWFMSHNFSGGNLFSSSPLTVSKGGSLSVGGNSKTQTIACNDGTLNLSGNSNTFTVTGHCLTLGVSGNNMNVTVDSADVINASGNNVVTIYHSGDPKTHQFGNNVSVRRG